MEWCHHDTSRLLPNHVGCMLIQSAYDVQPCLETPPSNTYRSICVFYQNHKHIMRVKFLSDANNESCRCWPRKVVCPSVGNTEQRLHQYSTSLQARMPDMYMENYTVQLASAALAHANPNSGWVLRCWDKWCYIVKSSHWSLNKYRLHDVKAEGRITGIWNGIVNVHNYS